MTMFSHFIIAAMALAAILVATPRSIGSAADANRHQAERPTEGAVDLGLRVYAINPIDDVERLKVYCDGEFEARLRPLGKVSQATNTTHVSRVKESIVEGSLIKPFQDGNIMAGNKRITIPRLSGGISAKDEGAKLRVEERLPSTTYDFGVVLMCDPKDVVARVYSVTVLKGIPRNRKISCPSRSPVRLLASFDSDTEKAPSDENRGEITISDEGGATMCTLPPPKMGRQTVSSAAISRGDDSRLAPQNSLAYARS